jgi:hypothetical protein
VGSVVQGGTLGIGAGGVSVTALPKLVKVTFRAHIAIPPPARRVEWTGWRVAPGLVVHRAILWNMQAGTPWRVTHEHSGKGIGFADARTRAQAVRHALALAPLADWTQGEKKLLGTVKAKAALAKKCRDAVETPA